MEGVIFVGLQASGKSSFFRERFYTTHIRLNLDMLRTRHREAILLAACIKAKQPVVIDNTNPTIAERTKYIVAFKQAQFKVVGFYFQSKLNICLSRNRQRQGKARIPDAGIRGTYNRLNIPDVNEGFDELYYVSLINNQFIVRNWKQNEL
ncbi:kinase [Achromatium sp. WMS1]|nr:kinase [Achromatium sp. WMS1]